MMGKTLWNDGWEFGKLEYSENVDKRPEQYEQVDVPHDWLIYDTQHLYEDSIGWYRKKFQYQKNHLLWIVRFEAIYMDSTIYVNGKEVSCWKNGYSTFDVDLTEYLVEGENELEVRAIHVAPNSRWYSGAGIYRNVWLVKKNSTHIVLDGVYITPVQKDNEWTVEIDSEVFVGMTPFNSIHQTIYNKEGDYVASVYESVKYGQLVTNSTYEFHHSIKVDHPKLWEIGEGNLYIVTTELCLDDEVIDSSNDTFGFRTIRMDANEGFFLNGRHVKIKGSCEHHGFGCLGAIVNKEALRRKLEILRSMGVNAIRTAHNMPSVEFMELADEMGFLVDTEAFDMWENPKTTYDYARFYKEWYKKDIASWVRRDRNHPSIIMWSVGNEIYDLHASKHGMEELHNLIDEVRKYDYKEHGKITFASNYLRWENAQKCADYVDVVGYNYTEDMYKKHHEEHPDWIIYGSETASMLASRNIYHFPLERDILCEDDQQCSALGNCFAGWGAHNYLDNIIADRDTTFSLGQFIWSGFDYFGEPTPYHTRNCYFGQIDTAGFPKDPFYIYQAEWTDYRQQPMIHIFPYWDFNPGEIVDVCVCSNAPKVELFLNGKSLGQRDLDHEHGTDLIPHWSIPYEKGELYAVAYNEKSQIIAKDRRHSFGDAFELRMKPNKFELSATGEDLILVEINAYDVNGYQVENANNRVQIEVSGAGRLVGIDNGDSCDYDQVKGRSKRLFGGKLLAVIASRNGEFGGIYVKATSLGIHGAELVLHSKTPSEKKTIQENQDYPMVAGGVGAEVIKQPEFEVPIRKIELICEEELVLTKEKRTLTIKKKVKPANATYHDFVWKIVNDIGIEVSLASLEIHEDEVVVTAKGDGTFYVRCIAMNGGSVASVRSSLCIRVEGIGSFCMNPYERISAGLCKERPDSLSEGEDHGVRFLGKKETYISYHNLDFGSCGTQEITMEMFKYMDGPIQFQIYMEEENGEENSIKSMDESNNIENQCNTKEGSSDNIAEVVSSRVLLAEGSYNRAEGWLVFKRQTYPLKQRVTGVKRIAIVSKDNFQLKSLYFTAICRGFEKIQAINYDEIFGDTYQLENQEVKNIGNNVSLVFKGMNFGSTNAKKLVICGRSDLENNSIHVKIEKDGNTSYELIEFGRSEEYVQREYQIKPINGEVEIRFVFLPGSQFDFLWFQFLFTT